ncbi:MAG: hypothetical protein EOP60_17100 [Sphingomonadales bacterium]|nr:MAG: hypothetical protein EOP60_17100 [Sphingomonadales bacterium]
MREQEQVEMEQAGDEIAQLASKYMLLPEASRYEKISCHISRALTDGNWDDLNKWHRVRLRLTRLCRQRLAAARAQESL